MRRCSSVVLLLLVATTAAAQPVGVFSRVKFGDAFLDAASDCTTLTNDDGVCLDTDDGAIWTRAGGGSWTQLTGGGASTSATYITKQAEGGLSAEQSLGSLTTGLLKNTVAASVGTLSTAAAATDYVAPGAITTSGLMQATARILGRTTASTGAVEELTSVPATLGGTGLTTLPTDDQTLVSNGSVYQGKTVPDCDNTTTSKLLYDQTTNAWSCGTDQDNGSAASNYQTVQDEGSSQTQRATLNFAGAGVTCADDTTRTTCTISGGGGGTVNVGIVNGRLTTESGVPVSTSDRTSQGTIYFTPYLGNQIALYDGAAWQLTTFTEVSLALSSLTSGKNYDVFIDYNGGTPQIVLGSAWTNDTTRADALATQDGVFVKGGGDTDHRYVGTIRTTGTTTTEDSRGGTTTQVGGKRYVWNAYNQVRRALSVIDTTDTWTYTTQTWRQANGASGNKVEFVNGLVSDDVTGQVNASAAINGVSFAASIGVGVDSTSAPSGSRPRMNANFNIGHVATWAGSVGVGYHFVAWLEYGSDGSNTFLGDAGDQTQSALTVTITN